METLFIDIKFPIQKQNEKNGEENPNQELKEMEIGRGVMLNKEIGHSTQWFFVFGFLVFFGSLIFETYFCLEENHKINDSL